jgi:hypothetical protein
VKVSQRTLVFAAIGAVAGLAAAGYSLFTAQGTAIRRVPPEAVALVNQRPILRRDYIVQLQSAFGVSLAEATRAQRDKVLQDMIREELLVQRGLELDIVSSDPDTRAALATAVDLQIAADITAQQPDEATLRAFYASHQSLYSSEGVIEAQDLVAEAGAGRTLAGAKADVEAARAALESGQPLDAVMARFRLRDTRAVNGAEFYFAAKIHLDGLFDAALATPAGGFSEPLERPDGIHLIRVVKNTAPVALRFEQVRDKVLGDYRRDRTDAVRKTNDEYLRARAQLLIAEDFK